MKKKGAPKGNQFWKFVKMPTGRPKKYTPGTLWSTAEAYFTWVDKHPLKEMKVFQTKYRTSVPKMRAMTETAFCLFAGIDENTWQRYKSHDDYKELWAVSNTIAKTIYVQKLEGAAADLLNGNIISRELGLKDRQEIEVERLPNDQLDELFNKIIKKANETRR